MVAAIIITAILLSFTAIAVTYIKLLDHANANNKALKLQELKQEHEKDMIKLKQHVTPQPAKTDNKDLRVGEVLNALSNLDNLWEDTPNETTRNN